MIDLHGHAKGEHLPFGRERPVPYTPRAIFSWFASAAAGGNVRTIALTDHLNLATTLDAAAVRTARRALRLAAEGDVVRAAQVADVWLEPAATLARELGRGLRCPIGVEADNDPRVTDAIGLAMRSCEPELIVRSIHFLEFEHPKTGEPWMWPFDNPEFAYLYGHYGRRATWERYATTLLDAIDTQATDVVGHFYVPAKFGHWPAPADLEAYEDRLIAVCARRSLAVEFNTRALYRGSSAHRETYLHVHTRLLEKAAAAGVPVALGSDAHRADERGRGFEAALELLSRVRGIDLYSPRAKVLA
ncbi:MAG TPA: hypothetical protein VMF61_00315 [Candidatus Acidoferrales bacterium]|nr:hypothetical protein [Candidatus Acidoferrales bacterium]